MLRLSLSLSLLKRCKYCELHCICKCFQRYVATRTPLQRAIVSGIIRNYSSSNNNRRNKTVRTSPRTGSQKFEYFHAKQFVETQTIPDYWPQVFVIPVRSGQHLLFPRFNKTFEINEPELIASVRNQITKKQPYAALFLRRNLAIDNEPKTLSSSPVRRLDEIHTTGTFVHIREMKDYGTRLQLRLHAVRRVRIVNQLGSLTTDSDTRPQTAMMVEVDNVSNATFTETAELKAMSQELLKSFREYVTMANLFGTEMLQQILDEDLTILEDTAYICDLAASVASATPQELQSVLEQTDIPKRLAMALALLKRDIEQVRLQAHIGKEVEENVRQMHRKFMLNQQIKVIQKELGVGNKDDRQTLVEKFQKRIEDKKVPPLVAETIVDETVKLQSTEGFSVDFNLVRNYLDWLTILPWGIKSKDNLNIHRAAGILNEHHHGMIDVKRRLLEFIAVSQLRGANSPPGRILCLYGPPGVGKTSVARSIAHSLNRQYFRFSVGGMTNAAEIKGHRRTYVGAMPGKLVQCLKTMKTENPLILIDEIDKMGHGMDVNGGNGSGSGDPASALLELLDPEQNSAFMDFYLDVPVDLSKVLFICTANIPSDIPSTLRDRMELIEMTGYLAEEKVAIAKEYLLPKALKDCGLNDENIRLDGNCLDALVDRYCSIESGVRNLQKMLEKICRKIAYDIVVCGGEKKNHYASISPDNLSLYLGKEHVLSEQRLYQQTPPGVVMGLGYSEHGGSIVYIETTRLADFDGTTTGRGSGHITLTGNLGAIMRESAAIALTVARNNLPKNECLWQGKIHVHLPGGGSHKEGPSAGITLVAALESLALNQPVRQNMAMTGELSLGGRVMGVGGIKEKTIAARRMGITCLILPSDNRRDFEAIPESCTKGLEVHFVSTYSDVHQLIFSKS